MRTITGGPLQLVYILQPHVVCLSGFRNPRAPFTEHIVGGILKMKHTKE